MSAFKAGRLLLEEARALLAAGSSFAIESTLSGKTYLALIREARARCYRFLLHYIVIDSGTQAVARVALRVRLGGHHVPAEDVHRRFDRSRRHFLEDYLPLADEWGLWDNHSPPAIKIADGNTHTLEQLQAMIKTSNVQEASQHDLSEMSKIVLEASRVATEKMLDYYRRMDIRVTPQMTLVEEEQAEPMQR